MIDGLEDCLVEEYPKTKYTCQQVFDWMRGPMVTARWHWKGCISFIVFFFIPLLLFGAVQLLISEDGTFKVSLLKSISGAGRCELFDGDWVADAARPLYNGSLCKWLAPGWACRKTNRPNFEYEQWRWRPRDCQLQPFNATEILNRMRNKVLAFVGDSLGMQQFQSLLCMLSQGIDEVDVADVGTLFGFTTLPGTRRPDGWAYNFTSTNFTVLFSWSSCLCQLSPYNLSNPAGGSAFHLDRPPQFLQTHLPQMDVLVLNTGHHWNRQKQQLWGWDFHLGGNVINLSADPTGDFTWAKKTTITNCLKWVDAEVAKQGGRPLVVLRTLSPRHFMDGEWDSGGHCDNVKKTSNAKLLAGRPLWDPLAESAIVNTSTLLLNITYLSEYRGESHPSRWDYWNRTHVQDCLHWCLPGVPDTWNELMYAQIVSHDRFSAA